MELTTLAITQQAYLQLFMMSKIQNLNGTHNVTLYFFFFHSVVYDVKDTKFEWNSQPFFLCLRLSLVDYDVKDTKFEWNSQRVQVTPAVTPSCL